MLAFQLLRAITESVQSDFAFLGRVIRGAEWVDIPSAVLDDASWPTLHRRTGIPDAAARSRIHAWRALREAIPMVQHAMLAPLATTRRQGIFDASRVAWDNLVACGDRGNHLDGWEDRPGWPRKITIQNPQGPLVISATLESFQVDLSDVEGISASKSSARHFDDVSAFGRDYVEYKGMQPTHDGLYAMLAHKESRIFHSGSDRFGLDMWDGRLFLLNSGGSHHFAGAAYIARVLDTRIPLVAELHTSWLHEPAWLWLLERYRLVHFADWQHAFSMLDVTRVAGECFQLELPPRVASGRFVLVNRCSKAAEPIIEMLTNLKAVEVTDSLVDLLSQQAAIKKAVLERWPTLERCWVDALSTLERA